MLLSLNGAKVSLSPFPFFEHSNVFIHKLVQKKNNFLGITSVAFSDSADEQQTKLRLMWKNLATNSYLSLGSSNIRCSPDDTLPLTFGEELTCSPNRRTCCWIGVGLVSDLVISPSMRGSGPSFATVACRNEFSPWLDSTTETSTIYWVEDGD